MAQSKKDDVNNLALAATHSHCTGHVKRESQHTKSNDEYYLDSVS
jgi:hypothetical protein